MRSAADGSRPACDPPRAGTGSASPGRGSACPRDSLRPLVDDQADLYPIVREPHAGRLAFAEILVRHSPAVLADVQAFARASGHLRGPVRARAALDPIGKPRQGKPPSE